MTPRCLDWITRVAALLIIALGSLGCLKPGVGGTPGPDAIDCAGEADPLCGEVVLRLETVRGNIGGLCGTPGMTAHAMLIERGAQTAPWLAGALGDRDVEVAGFAAWALVDLGQGERVVAWCAAHPMHDNHAMLCASALRERIQAIAEAPLAGRWEGTLARGPDAPQPVTLTLEGLDDALTGTLCGPQSCEAARVMRRDGLRVELGLEDLGAQLMILQGGRLTDHGMRPGLRLRLERAAAGDAEARAAAP